MNTITLDNPSARENTCKNDNCEPNETRQDTCDQLKNLLPN